MLNKLALIFALFCAKYLFSLDVRLYLLQACIWASMCSCIDPHMYIGMCLCVCALMCAKKSPNKQKRTETDKNGQTRTETDRNRRKWTETDRNKQKESETDIKG